MALINDACEGNSLPSRFNFSSGFGVWWLIDNTLSNLSEQGNLGIQFSGANSRISDKFDFGHLGNGLQCR